MVLLGTGVVGAALLRLLSTPAARNLFLVGAANSRRQLVNPRGLVPAQVARLLDAATAVRDDGLLLAALDASGTSQRVLVDATASHATAACQATWLAAGYHVVSANKAATGDTLDAWVRLRSGGSRGHTCHCDAATVGAGLPVLSTLRRLRACGDHLIALEGVFSGSLSWLFNHFDGKRPFSALLREARAFGYTEPDPRIDLGGADVARKLLILARSAGHALDASAVEFDNLVPSSLVDLPLETFLERLHELDAPLEARRARAHQEGRRLRFLATLDEHGNARAGLTEVEANHPAACLAGTDNLYILRTLRYRAQPLVIQGPGAGAEITAQALLGDLLALPGGLLGIARGMGGPISRCGYRYRR